MLSCFSFLLMMVLPVQAGMACGGHSGMGGGGGRVALILLALAVGYGVLVLSQNQIKPLDVLGRFIGGLILIVSFVGLLCIAACAIKCSWASCKEKMGCPYSRSGSACEMKTQNMDAAPPVDQPAGK
jgi:hypothetical protein